jgi:hypothetical protein
MFDFNDAPQQQGEVMPAKTLAKVVMSIKPGGHGDQGWLTKSDSGFEYLNTELTVSSAPYAKRKIFQNMGVGGETDGHQKAAQITRATLRAALESARGIDPKDESDQARNARQVNGWQDFNGLEFAVEIGIEKDKNGQYPDKNKVQKILTPDHSKYRQVMSGETIIPEGAAKQQTTSQQSQQAPWQSAKPEQTQPQQQGNPVPDWAR